MVPRYWDPCPKTHFKIPGQISHLHEQDVHIRAVLSRSSLALSVCALGMAEGKGEEATPAISPSDSGELPYEDHEIFGGEDRDEEEQAEKKQEKDTEGGEAKGDEEEAGEEGEAEAFHPSKRRKNCPAALEKSLSSNRGFSFSFDVKAVANGPIESTPKFGSFNHPDGIGLGQGPQCEEEKKKFGEESGEQVESGGEGEKGV